MGKGRKLLLAITTSVAIHAGAIGGTVCVHDYFSKGEGHKPKITKPVLHEERSRTRGHDFEEKKAEEKKPDLDALKAEKRRYIDELLLKLQKGRHIRLSEFFIKAEALDEKIRNAEKGEFGPEESELRENYFQILEKASKEALGKEDEVGALHEFLHTSVLSGYFYGSGSILENLQRGWYNCESSTKLFTALLEDVLDKKRVSILVFDDHLANILDGRRVDAVNPEWGRASMKFDGCGLVVPTKLFVVGYLLKNGVDSKEIPEKFVLFYNVRRSWKGCPEKEKNLNDVTFDSYSFPKVGAKSGMRVPSVFVPNPKHKMSTEKVVELARALFVAHQVAHIYDENEFVPTLIKNGKVKINPIIIPSGIEWGETLERFKSYFAANTMQGIWPERISCVWPLSRIYPKTIPEIISNLPEKEAKRLKYYSKEEICKRMKRVVETGTIQEMWGYHDYNFCPVQYPEVNEALKQRYMRERNGDVLRFGLADSAILENFEFFLDEFRRSSDQEIKRKAVAGMIFSDGERGCKILDGLPEKERLEIGKQIIWGCADEKLSWRIVELGELNTVGESAALGRLEGENLTRKQCNFLSRKGNKADLDAKIEIARIMLECGKKKEAFKFAEEVVKGILNNTPMNTLGQGRFPPELTPIFLPLLDSSRAKLGISKGIVCNGSFEENKDKVVATLRGIVSDVEERLFNRVEAAYMLLKLGHKPIE